MISNVVLFMFVVGIVGTFYIIMAHFVDLILIFHRKKYYVSSNLYDDAQHLLKIAFQDRHNYEYLT